MDSRTSIGGLSVSGLPLDEAMACNNVLTHLDVMLNKIDDRSLGHSEYQGKPSRKSS